MTSPVPDSAGRVVVLTGAGMSAECGIPVFRGSGGLWEGSRPEDLATPEAFAADPERVWRWYRERLAGVLEAEPHAGYTALAELERRLPDGAVTVITQNVDGMHRRAGSRRVVELHGNLTRARCSAGCGRTRPTEEPEPNEMCSCGKGTWRPDVVWFGESLDPACLCAAERALENADTAWVVGTSSVVYPAAALPRMAAERGVTVVEINPETTPLSEYATRVLRGAASEELVSLAAAWPEGSTR